MATIRKKHRAPVSVFQRDPGPWSRLLIDWLATLAVIMIFGLVMLFSASYTTGYLRMGDSFHYIKQQALCMMLGLGCMFLMSYVDHRFLRKMVLYYHKELRLGESMELFRGQTGPDAWYICGKKEGSKCFEANAYFQ